MIIKKHVSSNGNVVVAVCDDNLLGKIISDGRLQLDLSSTFYAGQPGSVDDLSACLPKAATFNFVGEESVAAGRKLGLIEEIKRVNSVPFAMVVLDRG